MQKSSIRDKVQDLYKWGTALGIFWGLAVAIFDLAMRASPFSGFYISTITSVTSPLYTQLSAMTTQSPLLSWLSDSIMAIFYVLVGYGVKITGTAISACWSFIAQKVSQKLF